MSRKTYISFLACLLCLLPMLAVAQSLTRLEYWFDNAFNKRRTISMSGTDYEVNTSISTEGLGIGTHKLHMRARRSD